MLTFREALIDARAEADNSPDSDVGGSHDWCVVFLQDLAAHGFKLIGPDASPDMKTAGMEASTMVRVSEVRKYNRISITDADAGNIFSAMHTAAPSIAEMHASKPIKGRVNVEEGGAL